MEHTDDERDARAVEDGGKHVAALIVRSQQKAPVAVGSPDRRQMGIEQTEVPQIEGVVRRDPWRECRREHDREGHQGRDHGHLRMEERIDEVVIEEGDHAAVWLR